MSWINSRRRNTKKRNWREKCCFVSRRNSPPSLCHRIVRITSEMQYKKHQWILGWILSSSVGVRIQPRGFVLRNWRLQQVIRLLQECRTDVHIDTLLYKACALDIKHFCAGIPQGEGRQMSCLLEALEDTTVNLHADCQRMLSERKEMWRYAIRESPPNSFPDLAAAINAPKARGQLLTILFLVIGVLGFGGLYCYSSRQKIQH
ncbi:Golgi apparatus protein 1-like isoform X2 [Acanthaster planci]|uniref:Golgi apparatus protein 1-like isoform X2 n=1 Tax=Acanthaster planci TaxID=133434 RepID=A0A8B7XQI7_ACAPL|nr:Golgi apparatus protein 1-like isoform X2 [Acanthaster planci]